MKRLTGVVGLLLLGFNLQLFASVGLQNPETKNIEAVVRMFWQALGAWDVEAMKQTIDYPFAIVESSGQTIPAAIIHSPAELEKEFQKNQPPAGKTKSDFYELTLSDLKIEMVNQGLAYLTYNLNFQKSSANPPTNFKGAYSTLTVLRKDNQTSNWKIVFTNIPK